MVPPFLAYYGVLAENQSLVQAAYDQCRLYRHYLVDDDAGGMWRHIAGNSSDNGHWTTGEQNKKGRSPPSFGQEGFRHNITYPLLTETRLNPEPRERLGRGRDAARARDAPAEHVQLKLRIRDLGPRKLGGRNPGGHVCACRAFFLVSLSFPR